MQQVMSQALSSVGKTAIAKQQRTAHIAKAATLDRPAQKQRSLPAERQPRKENVAGSFYVDHTCIDCDTCRWMDPATFDRSNEMSRVHHQPERPEQRTRAMQALLSCPTFSIHVTDSQPGETRSALEGMPMLVPGGLQNVYHCGFSSEGSYGSTSWLIVRPEGNILVDSPRWNPQLAERIKAMGGVKYQFLTHRDDVIFHDKWAAAMGCERLMHKTEVNRRQKTSEVEHQLEGTGPWQLPDGSDDIELIHVPGHTEGSLCLLYKPEKALFTGDHLNYRAALGRLNCSRAYNWYSYETQLESVHKLLDWEWLHVFPGHGRQAHLKDASDRLKQVTELLQAEGYHG